MKLEELKVVDLRSELSQRGLETHGLKSTLYNRLKTVKFYVNFIGKNGL